MNFKQWMLAEAALGVRDIKFDPQGKPSHRVVIHGGGTVINLTAPGGMGKSPRVLGSLSNPDVFGDTRLLDGVPLYQWHADIERGWGPFLYDIAMEFATLRGGYLVSSTFVNRLENRWDLPKGEVGGDASELAEKVYYYYLHNRHDVEAHQPNIMFWDRAEEQNRMQYMYMLYSKRPTTLTQLIELNRRLESPYKAVLVKGMGAVPQPILSLEELNG